MPLKFSDITVSLLWADTDKELPLSDPSPTDEANVPSAFALSEAGRAFKIAIDNELEDGLCIDVVIDGQTVTEVTCGAGEYGCIRGVAGTEGILPFAFGELKTKEDDEQDGTFVDRSSLGVIEVSACRAVLSEGDGPSIQGNDAVIAPVGPVSEKDKLLSWHTVLLGEPEPIEPYVPCNVRYIDSPQEPYATFKFMYRSIQALERLDMFLVDDMIVRPSVGDKRPLAQTNALVAPSAKRRVAIASAEVIDLTDD
ncbi:hypothetical protein PENSPDRAFT_691427 [Peniophora sp. CONT]|nr:hypothetical protein PENSPDRAFT_691427 [Peniophora sp. CONT]